MIIRKKLTPRPTYTMGETIVLDDEQHRQCLIDAFSKRMGYPCYIDKGDIKQHVLNTLSVFVTCNPPTPDGLVTDFDPNDLSVEIRLRDDADDKLTKLYGKTLEDIDLMVAWKVSTTRGQHSIIGIIAFHFQTPCEELS